MAGHHCNPLGAVRLCLASAVAGALGVPPEAVEQALVIPKEEFGDLAVVLSRLGVEGGAASGLLEAVKRCEYVREAVVQGLYLNVRLDRARFARRVLEAVVTCGENYGVCREERPQRVVVEYVSANPVHPLHIGAARNAALGSFIERILRTAGHEVQTRFYINDVGRQVAVLALGVKCLGGLEVPPGVKPDHWVGLIYAITDTLIEIERLRRELRETNPEKARELQDELDKLLADAARLRGAAPDVFDKVAEALRNTDPERELSEIMRKYEEGDKEVVRLVRSTVSACIEGFKETLRRFGAHIEVWDWESDLVWSGEVSEVLNLMRRLATYHKGAPALDFTPLLTAETRARLRIPKDLEVPPLILQRADGTTLYTVRDVAYTLKKFKDFGADKVINVIASEQTLPQAQLRLALCMLGYAKEAENTIHYSYEIVNVEGFRMSSRRGRIVTLDQLLEEAKERTLAELKRRGGPLEAAEDIGVAAVKFYLLSVSPSRPIKFSWDQVLNFERNSAPYVLYTYARTEGVFRKARELGVDSDPRLLLERMDAGFANVSGRRWRLVKLVAEYPDAFRQALRELDPSPIAVYLVRLADEFNSWYDEEPIVLEKDEGLRASKMLLTHAVRTSLASGLKILGIKPLQRM